MVVLLNGGKKLYPLFDIVLNSAKIVNKIIDNPEINEEEQKELKFIFTENLGNETSNLINNINILTNFFLNNEDNMLVPIRLADSGKRPVTMYHKTIYAQLNKLSSAILEEMEKYKMDE